MKFHEIALIALLSACTEQGAPTVAPAAGAALTCTVAEEGTQIQWNGQSYPTTVSVCSDNCLHFTKASQGWVDDTSTNCSASSWPSTTWNLDAYQDAKPKAPVAAPIAPCQGWDCWK